MPQAERNPGTRLLMRAAGAPAWPALQQPGMSAPAGSKIAFHAYARGVQIYRWNGSGFEQMPGTATFWNKCG